MKHRKSKWPRTIEPDTGSLEDTYSTTALYDLSPCPLCGSCPKTDSWQSFNGRIWVLNYLVRCWRKDHPSAGPFGTMDEARAAWNMQAVLLRKEPETPPDYGEQNFSACFDDAEDGGSF